MKIALRRTCLHQLVLVVIGNAIEPANNFSAWSVIGVIADRKQGASCNNLQHHDHHLG